MKKTLAAAVLTATTLIGAGGAAYAALPTYGTKADATGVDYKKNSPSAAAVANSDITKVTYGFNGNASDPRVYFRFDFKDLNPNFAKPSISLLDNKKDPNYSDNVRPPHYFLSYSKYSGWALSHFDQYGKIDYNICPNVKRVIWDYGTSANPTANNYALVSYPRGCFIKGAPYTSPIADAYWMRDTASTSPYVSDTVKTKAADGYTTVYAPTFYPNP